MIQLKDVLKFYKTAHMTKVVLNNVSTVFEPGWSYGLLGVNGAGKSTLLRVISGAELPNAGNVRRSVRISWPLGFGGGFHPMMTGRDNIKFAARIYGEDPNRVGDFVEDFSELGDYLDAPVQTYSSGMAVLVDGHLLMFDSVDKAIEIYLRLNR